MGRTTRKGRALRWSTADAMTAVAAAALFCAAFVHDSRNPPGLTVVATCVFLIACLWYRDAMRTQRARGVTPTPALRLVAGLRAVGVGLIQIFGAQVAFFFGLAACDLLDGPCGRLPSWVLGMSIPATVLAALPTSGFLRRRLWPPPWPEKSSRPDDPEPGDETRGGP